MKLLFAAAGAAAVVVGAVVFARGGPAAESFSPYVDEKGNISLPKDFRTWYFLGTWGVATDEDDGVGSKGIHNVYTQLETVSAFRTTGTSTWAPASTRTETASPTSAKRTATTTAHPTIRRFSWT